ncbi:MAG TPA: Gfo/Idh/MocA family oxidoreductase [Lacunisphaera sp.]|nr:Gfo/Idh/MocA family oxidoreductase [Lacunisphaera sp.]
MKIETVQDPATASDNAENAENPAQKNGATPDVRQVGYAVVGLGHIAQVAVLPGFAQAKNSKVTALVSGDRKKLQTLAKRYEVPGQYMYDQFDECLADPAVEALYVALPNDQHCDCVVRGAEAGKHILCEKPLALNVREARRMMDAAKANHVKLMTAYRLHYEAANLATIELIKSGKLGEPRYFNSSFSYQVTDPDNIRLKFERGGGPVYDIGIYCLNASRFLMRAEPIEVSAFLARSKDPRFDEVEETATVMLRYPEGRLATFVVSFGSADAARAEFVGTKGRVVLDPAFEYSEGLRQQVTIDGKTEEKTFPKVDQFGAEIEAFSECILKNKEPEPSGMEGLADLRVIDAIFRSAETGRSIRLPRLDKAQRPDQSQEKTKRAVKKPQLVNVEAPHD